MLYRKKRTVLGAFSLLVLVGLFCYTNKYKVKVTPRSPYKQQSHPNGAIPAASSPFKQLIVTTPNFSSSSEQKSKLRIANHVISSSSEYAAEMHWYSEVCKNYSKKLASYQHFSPKPKDNFIDYGDVFGKLYPHKSNKVKIILQWKNREALFTRAPSKITISGNRTCVTSQNRGQLSKSDAIVIIAKRLTFEALPRERWPFQRWAILSREPPHLTRLNYPQFNGLFNWTINYRRDADIQHKYFWFSNKSKPMSESIFDQSFNNLMQKKNKIVFLMVSNCDYVHTNRRAYVKEMQKYIPVDLYGKCGNLSCPRASTYCRSITQNYKFFLAAENNFCRDYITEKVKNGLLMFTAVPIVMGGADPSDYEHLLPRGSYINTAGFDSPKQLAEYLLFLDKHPELYKEYHRWKIYQTVTGDTDKMWSQLCSDLHNTSKPIQTYRDFYGYYDDDSCRAELPEAIRKFTLEHRAIGKSLLTA